MKTNFLQFTMAFWLIATCSFSQPVINSLQTNFSSLPRLQKLELTVSINAAYSNPYDYDEIALQAVFTAPSGRKDTVDGFFMQDYNLVNNNLSAVGTGAFKIRYAPNETGTWTYSLSCTTQAGTGAYPAQQFTCTESNEPGFIRRNNTNYLSFDNGNQYIPIGENVGWQNNNVVNDFTTWVGSLKANGGNFIRVWMSSWAFALEWKNNYNGFSGLKKYKQTNAYYFDWLLDYCKQNNVYVMTALNNHGQVSTGVNPEWNDNPYNAANGGPAANTWNFFTNATAKQLHKNRLRYIIARYAWSQTVQSWELFNEVEWTDQYDTRKVDVKNWHEEMANYIKSKDVYQHLVTTSFAKDVNDPATWNIPSIDFTQTHFYLDAPNIENTIANATQTYLTNFQKPTLNGEFGLGPEGSVLSTMDPTGIHIHNALWGTMFSGGLGTGMSWWWDSYIHPRNLYPYFKPVASVVNSIDFVKDNYRKTTGSITGGGTADASIVPGADWGLAPTGNFTIDPAGNITPATAQLSKYLYGSTYNTQFRQPPSFTVNFPVAGQFRVVTGSSTGTTPRINILVDGVQQLNVAAAINSTYSVNVAAGNHIIKVDNSGTDWMLISNYVFTNIGSPLTSYLLQSADSARVAGYIINNNYNFKYFQNSGGTAPSSVNGAVLRLSGLKDGPCKTEFFSCSTGLSTNSITSTVTGGVLFVPLPSVAWDVTFKVSTNFYRFNGNGLWSNAANWLGGRIPPANLPGGGEIVIDPVAGGLCIADLPQTISSKGKITVEPGKQLQVNGNLTIQ